MRYVKLYIVLILNLLNFGCNTDSELKQNVKKSVHFSFNDSLRFVSADLDSIKYIKKAWSIKPHVFYGDSVNGKREGWWRSRYGKDMRYKVMMISLYENDALLFTAYPAADQGYLFLGKGISMNSIDSITVELPFYNGNVWYSGTFWQQNPVGVHIINYPNGNRLCEIDHEFNTTKVYAPNGNELLGLANNTSKDFLNQRFFDYGFTNVTDTIGEWTELNQTSP